jgi:L-fucose mutarotase
MKYMMEMGHADLLVLADANFPGKAHAKRLIRMDTVLIPELLTAVMRFFPLDNFVANPVQLMKNLPTEPVPEIWETYREILEAHNTEKSFVNFAYIDRPDFYELSMRAFVVVQTGDTARYANIALQKGVL